MDIKAQCTDLRAAILELEPKLKDLKRAAGMVTALPGTPGVPTPDVGEMIANATLAFRHLEDARMRIGKVIQAFDGGTSCYKQ